MSENFAEMFEESITQMNMRVGEIITGEVVDINRDVVIVNAGLKSEGVIPVEQFYNESGELDVNIGDSVPSQQHDPLGLGWIFIIMSGICLIVVVSCARLVRHSRG